LQKEAKANQQTTTQETKLARLPGTKLAKVQEMQLAKVQETQLARVQDGVGEGTRSRRQPPEVDNAVNNLEVRMPVSMCGLLQRDPAGFIFERSVVEMYYLWFFVRVQRCSKLGILYYSSHCISKL
jgi:hypothetical protein